MLLEAYFKLCFIFMLVVYIDVKLKNYKLYIINYVPCWIFLLYIWVWKKRISLCCCHVHIMDSNVAGGTLFVNFVEKIKNFYYMQYELGSEYPAQLYFVEDLQF